MEIKYGIRNIKAMAVILRILNFNICILDLFRI